ncbi:MAG: guanylate kinase [Dysgonamonadaceae bacterium]|jgi:guanylate kinase|nr:guanylate kinase [Dysgonamonadaceae bacterium]
MQSKGKLVILSAPSGSGKSTIIERILRLGLPLKFSVSATSRPPRGNERDGVEYFFLSPEEFRKRIADNEFLEYEEVYDGRFYGTLRSEIEKSLACGENVILDLDVAGGLNVKRLYGNAAILVFIRPPSVEELRRRLLHRGTDSEKMIADRIAKAEYELSQADRYDCVVINDDLLKAERETEQIIRKFINHGN